MFKDVKFGDVVLRRDGKNVEITLVEPRMFKTSDENWHWKDDGKLNHVCESDHDAVRYSCHDIMESIVLWIREWFKLNGDGCKAVVGISGGKDSSVVAALCVEALGKDRVIGVLMPNGVQDDIDCSYRLVKHLDIRHFVVNIGDAYKVLTNSIDKALVDFNYSNVIQSDISGKKYDFNPVYWNNTPARLRMTTLYGIAAIVNGRVANTCNLSENFISYSTKFGDAAGDFSPLGNLTVTEVKALGYQLGLPEVLVEKVPADGMCGKTDEDNFGFTYDVLDKYIRTGICEDKVIIQKIEEMRMAGLHKHKVIDTFR